MTTESISPLQAFDSFNFDDDPQFQSGLQSVLSNIDLANQAKRDELILQAKIFFYNKKTGSSINFYQYQQWKSEENNPDKNINDQSVESSSTDPTSTSDSSESYPTSYQDIVELIMSGKPIPGIKQIPDTVLGEEASSKSTAETRRKPWEI